MYKKMNAGITKLDLEGFQKKDQTFDHFDLFGINSPDVKFGKYKFDLNKMYFDGISDNRSMVNLLEMIEFKRLVVLDGNENLNIKFKTKSPKIYHIKDSCTSLKL